MSSLVHIELLGGTARALIAHTTGIAVAARATHALSSTATAALGRALTATAMLACQFKGESTRLTLTLRGGGPLGMMVCSGKPDGTVKGYVENPAADPPRRHEGKLDVGAAVGKDGYLTVIRDTGFGEPYIGRTPLMSGEIAEDIAQYLLHSEQTASLLTLGVRVHSRLGVLGAGGALVQPMPGCGDRELALLEGLVPHLTQISRFSSETKDAVDLGARCLNLNLKYRVLQCDSLRYACDCGRERMESVLVSLGEKELLDMICEQHGAELTCHFCRKRYRFSESELRELLRLAKEGMSDYGKPTEL